MYILLCQTCNKKSKGLLHIFVKSKVKREFYEEVVRDYCFHCKALNEMTPEQNFEIEPENVPFHYDDDLVDIEILQTSPYKCAVLCKGEYGLITFPPRAKKPRCVLPCKNSKTLYGNILREHTK